MDPISINVKRKIAVWLCKTRPNTINKPYSALFISLAICANHRHRNRGAMAPQILEMNFGPHSFGKVGGIVFSDM